MRTLLLISSGLAAGAALAAVSAVTAPRAVASESIEPPTHVWPAQHSALPTIRAALEPARLESGPGGDSLVVGVHVKNELGGEAKAQWALELVDDRGTPFADPQTSKVMTLGDRDAISELAVGVPSGLPDGFYRLDLVAAGSDGLTAEAQGATLYVRVEGRQVEPLTSEDYYLKSRANLAVQGER